MARPAVLLDTNVLILYVVGLASPDYIARHKRLSAYSQHGRKAFDALQDFVSFASALQCTPNVLTEASNLLGRRDDELSLAILDAFERLVGQMEERSVNSATALARPEFRRLGLADSASLEALDDDSLLLTDDALLYDAALRAGVNAELFVNFLGPAPRRDRT